ncbi:MAG: response regulator transcription factor [Burkholderiales bacterium]
MNVLIIDDHPIVAEYLRGAAGRAIPDAVVRIAGDLEDAFEAMRDAPVDMVMLDLGLPGCGGIEALLRLRKAYPEVRVVVISSEDGSVAIRGALGAGAAGFIPKTAGPKVMVNALRLVAEGGRYIPPEALGEGFADRSAPPAKAWDRSPSGSLTDRQREVLKRLLGGSTISQIAADLAIAESTAKHHTLAVYAAFRVSSRADLILAAARRGQAAG